MLDYTIRTNVNVKGITLGNFEFKLCQFADDTVIFLDGSALSLNTTLDNIQNFSLLSGLRINKEKTKVFKIGQTQRNQIELLTRHTIIWSTEPLETLGIKIPIANRMNIYQLNYDLKINEMELLFKKWLTRNLSLRGKSTIIKTYGMSKLTYLASLLPNPPKQIINKIEKSILHFLWDGKTSKIRRDILINSYEMGGLNIPHFQTTCNALNISWIKRYLISNQYTSQWGNLVNNVLKQVGGKFIFSCNLKHTDVVHLNIKSEFWRHVITSWCSYNYIEKIQVEDLKQQIIWMNSQIRVANKPLKIISLIHNQFSRMDQLYEQGLLLDRNMLNLIYDIELSVMQYNSIISAIPRLWHRYMREEHTDNNRDKDITNVKLSKIIALPQKLVSKQVYVDLIKTNFQGLDLKLKWTQYLDNENIDNDWFLHIEKITIDNVMRSFQFKILHRIIYFNDKLYLFRLVNNSECDFCKEYIDSIEHRFWQCRISQCLWDNVIQWYNNLTNEYVNLNYLQVVSNICNSELLDFVVLSTKYYIYKCFLSKTKPCMQSLIREIKSLELIEKDIAIRKDKKHIHEKKWNVLATTEH
jgi:hypothetical protein